MRVAVSGADGFIGRHLMLALSQTGHTALSLGTAAEVDVRDKDLVRATLEALAPDVVVHLAAVSGPMLHTDEPEFVMAVNGVGTLNVLECAWRMGGTPVIVASSVSGYTTGTRNAPRPASIYGVTKRCTELLAEFYREEHALRCTSIRIGSVYGAGRQTHHLLDEMVGQALDGRPVRYDPSGREPLVHVRDAANLLCALTGARSWRPSYDMVTTPVSHAELARVVCELSATGAQPTPQEQPVYSWPVPFDSEPLFQDTGAAPRVDLKDGIRELLEEALSVAAKTGS